MVVGVLDSRFEELRVILLGRVLELIENVGVLIRYVVVSCKDIVMLMVKFGVVLWMWFGMFGRVCSLLKIRVFWIGVLLGLKVIVKNLVVLGSRLLILKDLFRLVRVVLVGMLVCLVYRCIR